MELNFEEINSTTLDFNLGQNNDTPKNYWENIPTNPNSHPKKPQVSYDDILSSLNMVVQNGVLKFSNPNQKSALKSNTNTNINSNTNQKSALKSNTNSNTNTNINSNIKTNPVKKQVTINHQQNVGDNYITNKYFKDYKEATEEENH